jgi:hypothetical protein
MRARRFSGTAEHRLSRFPETQIPVKRENAQQPLPAKILRNTGKTD